MKDTVVSEARSKFERAGTPSAGETNGVNGSSGTPVRHGIAVSTPGKKQHYSLDDVPTWQSYFVENKDCLIFKGS
jgi:hypothetical protein